MSRAVTNPPWITKSEMAQSFEYRPTWDVTQEQLKKIGIANKVEIRVNGTAKQVTYSLPRDVLCSLRRFAQEIGTP